VSARRVATRLIFMHQGKIWEQGSAAELLSKPRTPELVAFLDSDNRWESFHLETVVRLVPAG
jgi:ABC-type histidine transport system ATPase subunit